MRAQLSAEQRRRYWRDGLLFPVSVLSAEQAGEFRAAADRLESLLGGRPRTVEVRQMHRHFSWAYALATQPAVLDAVEALLGPDLLIWATELFTKHPRDANVSIGWHRDNKYTGFPSQKSTTAWIALTESTPLNGCMQAIPGPDRTTAGESPDGSPDRSVDVVLEAGEMSLHDGEVLHGSGANRSADKRTGFAIRYVTPQAVPPSRPAALVLARGQVTVDHISVLDPPEEKDEREAASHMKHSAALHLDEILSNLKQAVG